MVMLQFTDKNGKAYYTPLPKPMARFSVRASQS